MAGIEFSPTIVFTRQLVPQPPNNAVPDWFGVNCLKFYELDGDGDIIKDNKGDKICVWGQLVPEVENRDYQDMNHARVIYIGTKGWCIEFTITNNCAKKLWQTLFPRVPFKYFRDSATLAVEEQDDKSAVHFIRNN